METPTILQGNTFTLAIPLRVYIIDEGGVVLEDYTPDEGDEVVITLKGPRRFYTYAPRIDGNVARIDIGGYELCGLYSVAVAITKDDGQKLRTYRDAQLSIVESIDAVTDSELEQGIEQGALYLDAATFLSGADGRGIESVAKTATAGLVDTYTITYTDGTTSTFDVTNGRDGEDGQPGAPGADGVGIVSIVKTGTVGLVDTYTITLTNGSTTTFQVTNGKDGITPDMSDYYDKGETDALLAGKISTGGLKTINSTSLEGSGNLSLATQEALSNYCPIIEDTRSSAVANITGVAPFSQLADGQRIVLHLAFPNMSNPTLQLTLSNGTQTSSYDIYSQISTNVTKLFQGYYRGDVYLPMIFASNRWNVIADANTLYDDLTQALLNDGTNTSNRLISAKLLRDNFYIKQEVNNLCPIIEDTRSSAVAAITGVAPFASLVDGQRIMLRVAKQSANPCTLELTLSDGVTTTGAIGVYAQRQDGIVQCVANYLVAGVYYELVYDHTNTRWVVIGKDRDTTYNGMTQAEIDAGTNTNTRLIAPKLLCDNFDKVTTLVEVSSTGDVTQALDSGKFYKFGEVDSLTLTLNAASVGMAGYFGKFTTSASWTALSVPVTVDEAAGNDTIAASKTYEFNIIDDVILVKEV